MVNLELTRYEVTAGVLTVLSKLTNSSSCYTRRGPLKKVLQALPLLLALVLPTTESLEQAKKELNPSLSIAGVQVTSLSFQFGRGP